MSQDINRQPANVVGATSDVPFTEVKFSTLKRWHRARLRGAIILNRLLINGTLASLPKGSRRILESIAMFHGEIREHSSGLMLSGEASKAQLASTSGVVVKSLYHPLNYLAFLKVINMTKVRGEDVYELLMPERPLGGSPEEAEEEEEHSTAAQVTPTEVEELSRDYAQSEDRNPLQEPDSRAQCILREEIARNSGKDSRDYAPSKFGESDSESVVPDRAQFDALRAAPLAKLALAFSFLAREDLKAGRKTIEQVLHEGGMRPGYAKALARHPNATIDQVCGGIRKCELYEADGVETNREKLLNKHVKLKWANPEPEHARQIDALNLPEHEQEQIALAIEAERCDALAGQQGGRRGGTATLPAPPVSAMLPAVNDRLAALVNDLATAMPNAERDAAAIRMSAAAAAKKIVRQGDLVEDAFANNRRLLAALGADKLTALVDAAIAAAPNPFLKARYERDRHNPLESKALLVEIVRIYTGGLSQ